MGIFLVRITGRVISVFPSKKKCAFPSHPRQYHCLLLAAAGQQLVLPILELQQEIWLPLHPRHFQLLLLVSRRQSGYSDRAGSVFLRAAVESNRIEPGQGSIRTNQILVQNSSIRTNQVRIRKYRTYSTDLKRGELNPIWQSRDENSKNKNKNISFPLTMARYFNYYNNLLLFYQHHTLSSIRTCQFDIF